MGVRSCYEVGLVCCVATGQLNRQSAMGAEVNSVWCYERGSWARKCAARNSRCRNRSVTRGLALTVSMFAPKGPRLGRGP
jgi:hypothetical protein